MILLLIEWLEQLGIHAPAAFFYCSTRMVLSACSALLLCVLLGPAFIRMLYAMKIGQVIRKEECPKLGELHSKKEDTPTMGGLLILASIMISLLLWMDLTHIFTLILAISTIGLGALGVYDDYLKLRHKNTRGIKPRYKILWQGSLAALLAGYLLIPGVAESIEHGRWFKAPTAREQVSDTPENVQELSTAEYNARLYLPFLKKPIFTLTGPLSLLMLALIAFIIMGSSNAVNLTDGLDGLAAGCLVLATASLAIIAFLSNHSSIATYLHILYINGSGEIAVYLSALAGGCLGFLWYNGHPAQVFMGDTGSLGLGGVLGVCAVLLKRELLLGILGAVFVIETLSVIIQVSSFKLRAGKRVFLCAPLHHHFEYKGWPETKVVLRFWIVGLLFALLALASLKLQ